MLMAIMPVAFADTFTVTFDKVSTTASVSPTSATTDSEGILSAFPIPTNTDTTKEFDGWYTSADGGTKVTAPHQFSENTTLYAHWIDKTVEYNITVVSPVTGGTASADKTKAATGVEVTLSATASAGYRFKEYTSPDVTVSGGKFSMPSKDVTVTPVFEAVYPITINTATGGTVTSDKAVAAANEIVSLTVTPSTGYQVQSVTADKATVGTDYKFTMPAEAVIVTPVFEAKTFNITTETDGNGTLTAPATAKYGETVTLTATPKEGYIFDGWTVTGGATITDSKLTMPASDVTVKASFKVKPAFSSTYYASVSSPSRAVITSASTKVLPAGDSYTFAAKVTASGYYIGRVYVDGVNAGSPYLDTTTGVYYYTVNNKDTSAKTHTVVFNVYDSKGVPVTGDAGIWNYVVTMAASATAAAGIIIGKNKKK